METTRTTMIAVVVVALVVAAPTMAVQHVEDFEYETPASDTFTNGVFQHNIVPIPPLDYVWWEISDDFSNPTPTSGNALVLAPATDEVTFDLGLGEYVNYAAIDFADWGGGTTFEVIGTLDTYSVSISSGGWGSADTSGQSLGEITMIKLISYEGVFDNLTIDVVPEPATLGLLLIGGLALLKRRRSD